MAAGPRNQPKSLNHIGQRMFRWPFVLFISCSSVQNFPKFFCSPAFSSGDCVRITHGGLRFGVPKTIEPDRHRRTDLIEQRSVAMPKGMEPTLRNAKLLQQRMKLALPNQTVIPRRARFRCKQQPQRVRAPGFQIFTQMLHQFHRDRKATVSLARLHCLKLTPPHTLSNVDDGVPRFRSATRNAQISAPRIPVSARIE
jgi:hypothetical protein